MAEKRQRVHLWMLRERGTHRALAAVCACFLFGGVLGCLAVRTWGISTTLKQWLEDYLTVAAGGMVQSLTSVLRRGLLFPVAAILVGTAGAGAVCLPLLLMGKGFLLSFAVGTMYLTYGSSGMLVAVLIFGIAELIQTAVLFLVGELRLRRSLEQLTAGGITLERERKKQQMEWLQTLTVAGLLAGASCLLLWTQSVWLAPMLQRIL